MTDGDKLGVIRKVLELLADEHWQHDEGKRGPYYDQSVYCERCRADPEPMRMGTDWRDATHEGNCLYALVASLSPEEPSK